jgi:hypothetical protein
LTAIPLAIVGAAVIATVVFLRSEKARPRRRGLLITAGVAAALAALGVVLLGIPGAVVYELFDPLVRAVLGRGYAELGAGAWAAAIVTTLVWPSSLVLAYAVAWGPLRRRPAWTRWTVMVLVPCAAAAALAFWPHLAS